MAMVTWGAIAGAATELATLDALLALLDALAELETLAELGATELDTLATLDTLAGLDELVAGAGALVHAASATSTTHRARRNTKRFFIFILL